MPFKSDKQRRFLFAKHPEVAEKFASETKSRKGKKGDQKSKDETPPMKGLRKART